MGAAEGPLTGRVKRAVSGCVSGSRGPAAPGQIDRSAGTPAWSAGSLGVTSRSDPPDKTPWSRSPRACGPFVTPCSRPVHTAGDAGPMSERPWLNLGAHSEQGANLKCTYSEQDGMYRDSLVNFVMLTKLNQARFYLEGHLCRGPQKS